MPARPELELPPQIHTKFLAGWGKDLKRQLEDSRGKTLASGINLHTSEHVRLYAIASSDTTDDVEVQGQRIQRMFSDYWQDKTGLAFYPNLSHYMESHAGFEKRIGHWAPVGFFLDAVDDFGPSDPEPELFMTTRGVHWFGRRIQDFPPHSKRRALLKMLIASGQSYLEKHRLLLGNGVKSIGYNPNRSLWLFHADKWVLENEDLDTPNFSQTRMVAVMHPINTNRTTKDDTFMFVLRVPEENLGEKYEVMHVLQVPAILTDNPEMEVRDAMKLYLTAGSLKNRRIVLEFNKFTTYYAETFELRHAPVKGGATRFIMGNERAHLYIQANNPTHKGASDYLEIRVEFNGDPSRAFYGRVVTFVGAFLAHCRLNFYEDLKVDRVRSELIDFEQIETWGLWAYQEVLKRFPKLNQPKEKQ
jgi:hypothetical protein